MTELENIINWFYEENQLRHRALNISIIAQESRINAVTLRKFLNKEKGRNLTTEQITKLIPIISKFGYTPITK